MSYYTQEQLKELGFKYIGKNVKIRTGKIKEHGV